MLRRSHREIQRPWAKILPAVTISIQFEKTLPQIEVHFNRSNYFYCIFMTYMTSVCEKKKFGRSTAYSCRTNVFLNFFEKKIDTVEDQATQVCLPIFFFILYLTSIEMIFTIYNFICFKEIIGFDVKATCASRPVSRLIR